MRTRPITTIRCCLTMISYLRFIGVLAMLALPIRANRSTAAAAAKDIRQSAGECSRASLRSLKALLLAREVILIAGWQARPERHPVVGMWMTR